MASEQFSWLTLSLIKPDSFKLASAGLSSACNHGTRHFAANGRTVDLADAPKVAHEIRQYELEKDDLPRVPSRHLMKRSSYPNDSSSTQAGGISAQAPGGTVVVAAIERNASPPSKSKFSEKVRGERHFDGVNSDWGDYPQFELGKTFEFREDR